MIDYNKFEIRNTLTLEQIFELLDEFGGEPEYSSFGIISRTICHNNFGEGSRKLYYYTNTKLFHCYSGCADPSFDIFELVIKIMTIQYDEVYELNDAVRYIAIKFGISGILVEDQEDFLDDWKIFNDYSNRQQEDVAKDFHIQLDEIDPVVLTRFNYQAKIMPWIKEGISQETLEFAQIGFYPGGNQITIPHFDKDNRLVGIRGRTVCSEDAERYGKYRPIVIMDKMYNHPLGMNLYGLNFAKDNIAKMKKAIIFESEKSVLKYISFFGKENNIAVACCGSSISNYQIQMLLDLGVQEIVIGLDRQFQSIGDEEYKYLVKKLTKISDKYHNDSLISIMFDKNMITGYKASPIDEGVEKFLTLFKERIIL